ncbi:MAG: LytTR family DNA-binding domain-containing protein [Reichenbachiella sp.]|uniref:LytR/AlgR family response regulator transcription factor n=1 Tax=Reichenbachiella sp. TaxID=2184521 RepID=UPI0032997B01
MFYHVQPTYLPEWDASSFFIISELMNTLLDVNLAAILPIGNSLYKLWISSSEKQEINRQKFIYLKVEKRLEKVVLDDIVFVESLKNYIKVKTSEKEIVAYKSLTTIQDILPTDKFLRVHRSFIIGIAFVESFSPNQILLGTIKIPVGRTYKEEVKKRLGYF